MKNWKEYIIAALLSCILFCGLFALRLSFLDTTIESKSLLFGLLCGFALGCLLLFLKKGILLAVLSVLTALAWWFLPVEAFSLASSALLGAFFSLCLCLIPFFASLMVRGKRAEA